MLLYFLLVKEYFPRRVNLPLRPSRPFGRPFANSLGGGWTLVTSLSIHQLQPGVVEVNSVRLRIPRFRLRMLLLLVTLAGTYLGTWQACKPWAFRDVHNHTNRRESGLGDRSAWGASSRVPFVVGVNETRTRTASIALGTFVVIRRYYLWCFGPVIELPYRREVSRWDVCL